MTLHDMAERYLKEVVEPAFLGVQEPDDRTVCFLVAFMAGAQTALHLMGEAREGEVATRFDELAEECLGFDRSVVALRDALVESFKKKGGK